MTQIIALSAKRGCGKSTLARMLIQKFKDEGLIAEPFSLATVLKQYVTTTYGIPLSWSSDQDMKQAKLSKKDFPGIPEDGMTLRKLLQETGAELRKKDPAFTVHGIPESQSVLIIDDVRMPAEDNAMKELQAFRVRVEPYPEYAVEDSDITETALDDVADWDLICFPEFGNLQQACEEIFAEYQERYLPKDVKPNA